MVWIVCKRLLNAQSANATVVVERHEIWHYNNPLAFFQVYLHDLNCGCGFVPVKAGRTLKDLTDVSVHNISITFKTKGPTFCKQQ